MREIYFDNAATTRVRPEVAELMMKVMTEDYGNPSARHVMGMKAENYIKTAREQIARTPRVDPGEIYFTSGGTESNNLALIGTALARSRRGKHIISTGIEHAAIYKPLDLLREQGFDITILPVDRQGHIDLSELSAAIRPDTILVSLMYVNNEIGSIEPIAEAGRIIKERNPECYFHTDTIQAYGKLRIRPKTEHIDMLSVSAHKIHGPKGTGFIYIDKHVRLHPLILGGGQERDMRSGTENVPGIAGMGLAAEMYYKEHEKIEAGMLSVRDRLIDRLSVMEGVKLNTEKGEGFAPHVVSASFAGVRAEVLLHALEQKGIYVSSGSACSSNHPAISGTLRSIGVDQDLLDSTLRFSFGIYSTPEEADLCADALEELLPQLRRFVRR